MKYDIYGNYKQSDLNLYIVDKNDCIDPGARYGPVIRDLYIIQCNGTGYGSVIINDKDFAITPKTCVILFPGDVITHTASLVNPRTDVWVGINGIKISSYLDKLGITSDNPYAPPEAFDDIQRHLRNLYDMKDNNDAGAELRRNGELHLMFGDMLKYIKLPPDNRYVQHAIGIMETRYNENLKISEIADELGLDRSYFSTVFTQNVGMAPYAYLTELRIKKACSLLEIGGMSIKEVANAVGIEPMNFSRLFKKHIGTLPSDYINNLRTMPTNIRPKAVFKDHI